MTHSKQKQQKYSKRFKTQPIGYSAFDDSIFLLTLSKIHKALHDVAKSKLQSLSLSITQINKEMNVISAQCKHKQKLALLITHLNIFELIQLKKYKQALNTLQDKSSHFNDKTHKILKLSIQLLHALILKHLERQEESKDLITRAIKHLDLTQFKVKPKSSQQNIIETAILSISITAQQFAKFHSQSFDFRQIYTEAYRIAYKYLTQYHKLTQTLFMICRKFPQQNTDTIRNSKKKNFKTVKKRNSLNPNSNRYFLKDSRSDRSYLNHTIQPKSMSTLNETSDIYSNIRHTEIPKRLRTIDPYIDIREEKQLCLSKLYGTDLKELKQKTAFDKKYFKKAKPSTSLKPAYEPHDAVEMKQLQKISKLYLPKLQAKRKNNESNKKQKLNAAEVLKFGSTLSRLKPNYFDRIITQISDRICHSQAKHALLTINNAKETRSIKKIEKIEENLIPIPNSFDNLPIQKDLKEKLLIPLIQSHNPQTPQNQQESCQLI